MFNFDETRNLGELKELCFYIKAINESGFAHNWSEHIGKILAYLKKEYNLEVSASKLYLFVQKILYIANNEEKFPSTEECESIINAYIDYIRDNQKRSAEELNRAELNYEDPKYEIASNKYLSTKELSTNISLKENVYTNLLTKLLIWSVLIGIFVVALTCCTIGVFFPQVFKLFLTKPQELAILLLLFCVVGAITYLILYLTNLKQIKNLSSIIKNYYKYEPIINLDEDRLKSAKHNLFVANSAVCVNGIELSNDMLFSYLNSADKIDISYFNKKNGNNGENKEQTQELAYARIGQTISSREQNNKWRSDDLAIKEKQYINREIVVRINELAETIANKNLSNERVAHSISELYCNELSVEARDEKINHATSKIELAKNYINMIDKIKEFETMNFFVKSKLPTRLKSVMLVTPDERVSFERSLNTMISRIEKAHSLGLLSKGQAKTYKNVEADLKSGIVQGMQLDEIEFRYDLAKLYVKLYEELELFDVLN